MARDIYERLGIAPPGQQRRRVGFSLNPEGVGDEDAQAEEDRRLAESVEPTLADLPSEDVTQSPHGALQTALDVLDLPRNVVANIINVGVGAEPTSKETFAGLPRVSGADILRQLGLSAAGDDPEAGLGAKVADFATGFAADVALDPLTYLTFGASGPLKGAASRVGRKVLTQTGERAVAAGVKAATEAAGERAARRALATAVRSGAEEGVAQEAAAAARAAAAGDLGQAAGQALRRAQRDAGERAFRDALAQGAGREDAAAAARRAISDAGETFGRPGVAEKLPPSVDNATATAFEQSRAGDQLRALVAERLERGGEKVFDDTALGFRIPFTGVGGKLLSQSQARVLANATGAPAAARAIGNVLSKIPGAPEAADGVRELGRGVAKMFSTQPLAPRAGDAADAQRYEAELLERFAKKRTEREMRRAAVEYAERNKAWVQKIVSESGVSREAANQVITHLVESLPTGATPAALGRDVERIVLKHGGTSEQARQLARFAGAAGDLHSPPLTSAAAADRIGEWATGARLDEPNVAGVQAVVRRMDPDALRGIRDDADALAGAADRIPESDPGVQWIDATLTPTQRIAGAARGVVRLFQRASKDHPDDLGGLIDEFAQHAQRANFSDAERARLFQWANSRGPAEWEALLTQRGLGRDEARFMARRPEELIGWALRGAVTGDTPGLPGELADLSSKFRSEFAQTYRSLRETGAVSPIGAVERVIETMSPEEAARASMETSAAQQLGGGAMAGRGAAPPRGPAGEGRLILSDPLREIVNDITQRSEARLLAERKAGVRAAELSTSSGLGYQTRFWLDSPDSVAGKLFRQAGMKARGWAQLRRADWLREKTSLEIDDLIGRVNETLAGKAPGDAQVNEVIESLRLRDGQQLPRLSVDPVLAAAGREIESTRMIGAAETLKELARRFGTQIAKGESVPAGLVKLPTEQFGDLLRNVAFTPEVATVLRRHATQLQDVSRPLEAYRSVLGLWKQLALAAPAYHVRNMFGNVWNAMMLDGFSLDGWRWGLDVQRAARTGEGLSRQIPGTRETVGSLWRKLMVDEGVVGSGFFGVEARASGTRTRELLDALDRPASVGKASSELLHGAPLQANRTLGQAMEENAKVGFVITRLRRGDSLETAVEKMKLALFDYNDLTDFEKGTRNRPGLRDILPFYCVPDDAAALTRAGWKHRAELQVGEEICTYNQELDALEWQPLLEVASFAHDQELHTWSNRRVQLRSTFAHRWIVTTKETANKGRRYGGVRSVVTSADLNTSHQLLMAAKLRAGGRSLLTVAQARLYGWLITDGYFRFRGNHCEAVIYQHPKKHFAEVCRVAGGKPRKPHPDNGTVAVPVLRERLAPLLPLLRAGKPAAAQFVGQLSAAAAAACLDAVFKADGSRDPRTGTWFVAASEPGRRGAIEMLAALCGMRTHASKRGVYLSARRTASISAGRQGRERYCGVVWCPRTANGTWVMRQGAVVTITGNTFSKNNAKLILTLALSSPAKLALVPKLQGDAESALAGKDTLPPSLRPAFVQQEGGIQVSGGTKPQFLNAGYMLPVGELGLINPLAPRQAAQKVLDSVAGPAKTAIELATNYDSFQDKPIREYPEQRKEFLGVDVPPELAHVARSVRPLNFGNQVLRSIETSQTPEQAAGNVAAQTVGVRTFPVDVPRQIFEAERRINEQVGAVRRDMKRRMSELDGRGVEYAGDGELARLLGQLQELTARRSALPLRDVRAALRPLSERRKQRLTEYVAAGRQTE